MLDIDEHSKLHTALGAIQKVRESLEPEDWCGDESMIAALNRAEVSINEVVENS